MNGEVTKFDPTTLKNKNHKAISNSHKIQGNAIIQYTHPKNGNLFRSSGAVSEPFDLVRRGEIKMSRNFGFLIVIYNFADNRKGK